MKQKPRTMKVIHIVTMGLLSTILFLGQVGMSMLPNIEPVTLLIILYTLVYKKRVFYIIYAFVFLEGLIYGFGIWWISYLYIWTISAAFAYWASGIPYDIIHCAGNFVLTLVLYRPLLSLLKKLHNSQNNLFQGTV